MRLTEHFTLEEFERSSTARRLGIDNRATDPLIVSNLRRLCLQVLEPLRTHANRLSPPQRGEPEVPVIIGSGYRCPRLNRAVGGVEGSNHLTGCAADLRIPSPEEGREWFDWLHAHCPFDELVWERTSHGSLPWIHVALRPSGNRHKVVSLLVKGN